MDCELENFKGRPEETSRKINPFSQSCIDQLVSERLNNPELNRLPFYPADNFIYYVQDDITKLAITRGPSFFLEKSQQEDLECQAFQEHYSLSQDQLQQVIENPYTVIINLLGLRQTCRDCFKTSWGRTRFQLKINCGFYRSGMENKDQQKLINRLLDAEKSEQVLGRLYRSGIKEMSIFTYSSGYVSAQFRKYGPFCRGGCLHSFQFNSNIELTVSSFDENVYIRAEALPVF